MDVGGSHQGQLFAEPGQPEPLTEVSAFLLSRTHSPASRGRQAPADSTSGHADFILSDSRSFFACLIHKLGIKLVHLKSNRVLDSLR